MIYKVQELHLWTLKSKVSGVSCSLRIFNTDDFVWSSLYHEDDKTDDRLDIWGNFAEYVLGMIKGGEDYQEFMRGYLMSKYYTRFVESNALEFNYYKELYG